jgi:uncharacterized protein YukE
MLLPTNNTDTTNREPNSKTGGTSISDLPVTSVVPATMQISTTANLIPSTHKRTPKIRYVAYMISLLLLILLLVAMINQQKLYDWWRLRGYTPPAYVAQLATQDTMNSYTRHLFYLNRPKILNTVQGFRDYCPENKNTIVLGCYRSGQNGIFIYNVPDPTLAGVTEVTAAHEVLHSVYARLSGKERNYVNGLLESYYKNDLHNATVLAEVKLYQETEPRDVMDEMNSTFGTEILNLPPALNSYYGKYFTDRSAIVHYEQQYEVQLTTRLNTVSSDDKTLASLQQSIQSQEGSLQQQYSQIEADHQQLTNLLNADETSSYNAQVDSFNSEVDAYNSAIGTLQANISSYNQLVTTRNLIAGQLTTLDKALDTRLSVQTTQK